MLRALRKESVNRILPIGSGPSRNFKTLFSATRRSAPRSAKLFFKKTGALPAALNFFSYAKVFFLSLRRKRFMELG
jgi:hypothetical protein